MSTFVSDSFLLRPIVMDDIEFVFKGLSHPEVIKYYGVSYDSLEATKEQMEWYESLHANHTGAWWAIVSLDKNEFYGAVGINNYQPEHRKAELGYWLLPEYWGRGLMQVATKIIVDFVFESFHLNRLEATVEPENTASKVLLQRLGFQYEGCMRQTEIKNGQYIDLEMYARLKNDYL